MFRLVDLPPEVLSDVTCFLTGEELSRLWLSGEKLLQSKLGEGGGARIFYLRPDNSKPIVWPSLVSVFSKLTFLEFFGDWFSLGNGMNGEVIAQLPCTLRRLSLRFGRCFFVFQEAMSLNNAVFPNLKSIYLADFGDPAGLPGIKVLQWPNSLLSLEFALHRARWFDLDLASLPPGLTSITAPFTGISNTHIGFPSTLTKLNIFLMPAKPLLFSILPDSLLTLCLTSSRKMHASEWDFSLLPRTLESLFMKVSDMTREDFLKLPKSLTRLGEVKSVDSSGDSYVDFWPLNLKDPGSLIPFIMTKDFVKRLPRRLEVGEYRILDSDAIPYLPPNVRHIVCTAESMTPLVEELAKLGQTAKIPVNFQNAALGSIEGLPGEILPDSLTELTLAFQGTASREFLESIRSLKLQSLNMFKGQLYSNTDDWIRLPRTLDTLATGAPPLIPTSSALLLPTRLKVFRLNAIEKQDLQIEKQWFAALPNTISNLHISGITRIFNRHKVGPSNGNGSESIEGCQDHLLSFPIELSVLTLEFSNMEDGFRFTEILKSLPHHLITFALNIPKNVESHIVDSDLDSLPPTLKHLAVPKQHNLSESFYNQLKVRYRGWFTDG